MTLSRKAAICAKRAATRHLAQLSILLLIALAGPVYAWSEAGHIMFTELAVRQLPIQARQQANEVARALPDTDTDSASLRKRYGQVADLSALGAWLDGQRGREVGQIFADYDARLPAQLKPYAQATTDDWHYSNRLYYDEGGEGSARDRCAHLQRGELNAVLPRLIAGYQEVDSVRGQALILAMLVHLVADAHQPLHSMTRVTDDCDHDRGGNGFCVKATAGGRCKNNLHRLWDGGFGAFHQDSLDRTLQFLADPSVEPRALSLNPEHWQQENFALANQIYALREGQGTSPGYRNWAQGVVRERVDLGAKRLASILTQLLEQEP